MVYSFDVFDTVITRKTATANGIFSIMQRELIEGFDELSLLDDVRSQFYKCRVEAEVKARKMGKEEVTIYDIYELFGQINGVDDRTVKSLIEIEIKLELQLFHPVKKNVEFIERLLEFSECYFISDMYLPLGVIKKMLLQCSAVFEKIPILLSCEIGKTKRSGTLYDYFIKENRIDVSNWIHIGDNEYSDVKMVFSKGGTGKLYKQYVFSNFEKKLLQYHEDDEKLQIVLGTIKNTCDKTQDTNNEVGIGVGGPILYSYVLWVIQNSLDRGIRQLYFIARDGYILKKIADIIIENNQLNLQTFYLYGSRKAWRIPAICQSIDDLKDWFVEQCRFNSLSELADILELSREYLSKYVPGKLSSCSELYSEYEQKFIKSKIGNSLEVLEYVQKAALQKRKRVIQYLRQELPEDLSKVAFVELNGSGYTQWCLNKLINGFSESSIMTYYYILMLSSNIITSKVIFSEYLHESFEGNSDILEILARAPYGQTDDYKFDGKEWKPVLKQNIVDYPSGNSYEEYLQGILEFTCKISKVSYGMRYNYNEIALKYLEQLYHTSEKKILDFIGDMPFSTNGCMENMVSTYAPKLSDKAIRSIYLMGNKDRKTALTKYYAGNNLYFSELRLSQKQRIKIHIYAQFGELVKRIPIYKIKKNPTRIIVYGAGIIGERVYWDAKKNGIKVVLWVDKNYMHIKKHKVEDPQKIIQCDYDFIVVAIKSAMAIKEVKSRLKQMGVSEEKIV